MNDSHKHSPDPEIRKKYNEWAIARAEYEARAAGCATVTDLSAGMARQKAHRKSVQVLLQAIGGQKVKGSKFTASASKKQGDKRMRRMQRTGGQRGS